VKILPISMKNICPYLICIITAQLFIIVSSSAQSVTGDLSVLRTPPGNISIDGDLKDWGDSLQYYNAESNTRYVLSNDKQNLYFAIKINNPTEIARVLRAGITLGVDPKGKKKSVYNITFPVNTQLVNTAKSADQGLGEITQTDRDELHKQILTSLRGIRVEGFKDIESDMITTSNSYGIKTAIDYDANGNLVCEAAIPLKFFNLDDRSKTAWIFDIKINGVVNPAVQKSSDNDISSNLGGRGGMGGGRGGMGGGRGGKGGTGNASTANGNTGSVLYKSVDFSGKFYLAAVQ